MWARLTAAKIPVGSPIAWPSLTAIYNEIVKGDYSQLLENRADIKASGSPPKRLCAIGMVARAAIEWLPDATQSQRWTGLFAGESTGLGILRLSTACDPPLESPSIPAPLRVVAKLFGGSLRDARLFPCVAFKVPRKGTTSANLLLAGRKTGQADGNFFASCVATALTEKAAGAIKPVLDAFRRYSRYPTHLGLSDFAHLDRDGRRAPEPRFPWCLCFRPTAAARARGASAPSFLQQLDALEPGAVLYDIFAAATPEAVTADGAADGLLHVGRLVLHSRFIRSTADSLLVFHHQPKEEDYALRPDWEAEHTDEKRRTVGAENFARLIRKQELT
jgi:hypothetical protein